LAKKILLSATDIPVMSSSEKNCQQMHTHAHTHMHTHSHVHVVHTRTQHTPTHNIVTGAVTDRSQIVTERSQIVTDGAVSVIRSLLLLILMAT